jgi:hypothetical protein
MAKSAQADQAPVQDWDRDQAAELPIEDTDGCVGYDTAMEQSSAPTFNGSDGEDSEDEDSDDDGDQLDEDELDEADGDEDEILLLARFIRMAWS